MMRGAAELIFMHSKVKIVLQRCGYFVDFTVGTVGTLSFIVVMRDASGLDSDSYVVRMLL